MAGDSDKAFELEGMVTALNVLRVLTSDLGAIGSALTLKIAESPGVFSGAPVVIDVSALEPEPEPEAGGAAKASTPAHALPIAELVALLKQRGLVPVGAYARTDALVQEAQAAGLPLLDARRRSKRGGTARKPQPWPDQERPPSRARARPAPDAYGALMLTQPLRSGQIVHAEHRDAIALAAISSGAELIADGNIHVYAPLRGRALAGARGDEQARIFCQKLEADLVSVAGVYLSADDLPEDKRGKAVQIFLRDDELVVADLVPR